MTGAFSQNVGKLFSELKMVTDNLFIYGLEALSEVLKDLEACLHKFPESNYVNTSEASDILITEGEVPNKLRKWYNITYLH